MNRTKGFSLIELLVVIAIIGILSSVILAALNTARNKGKDSSAQSSLENIRAAAELYLSDTGINGYAYSTDGPANLDFPNTGVCADPEVKKLMLAASTQTGNPAVCRHNADGVKKADQYRVAIELLSGMYYCVDSTGLAVSTTTDEVTGNSFTQCE